MMMSKKKEKSKARAFPISDDQTKNKANKDKSQMRKLKLKLRISSWNLGSLNRRSLELAETLKRRKVHIACIQETKWKGSKAKEIGLGYKLYYNGESTHRNGVAIVLNDEMQRNLVDVTRISDRIMYVKLANLYDTIMNIICVYAPQQGTDDQTKLEFWERLHQVTKDIPSEEMKIICGDLNGHVGERSSTFSTWHGGHGFGTTNEQGLEILQFASTHDLAIVNTYFTKNEEHLITYKSGDHKSQIDYILCDREKLKSFKDCKVIPGEALTTQHRLVVADLAIKEKHQKNKSTPMLHKIRWHRLKSHGVQFIKEMKSFLKCKLMDRKTNWSSIDSLWKELEDFCTTRAKQHLGVSKGPLKIKKETWWWNEEVQVAVKKKKMLFKKWQSSRSDKCLKEEYKLAKKQASIQVSKAKQATYEEMYEKLETKEGEREIYRIARQRHHKSKDITTIACIKDKNGKILTKQRDIDERWAEYFNVLLNEEFDHQEFNSLADTIGPIEEITDDEVKTAILKMKNEKSVGPDNIPAEVWKLCEDEGTCFLTSLFNNILYHQKIPQRWKESFISPIYKNKGDSMNCGNYRGISLTSHTLKIWERVLNGRLTKIVNISPNQTGFVSGRSTMDAIHAVRTMIEKYKENKKDLHMAFLDLEKAFDRVPTELVIQSLQAKMVPKTYIEIIKDMYHNRKSRIKSSTSISPSFNVNVGVQQGSALSPFLFNNVMDHITAIILENVPWDILYADDVVLIAENKMQLQEKLNKWYQLLTLNGLRLSIDKTEYMHLPLSGLQDDRTTNSTLYVNSQPLKTTTEFKYLGSIISNDGKIDKDANHRISCAWMKWKTCTGVLCDKKFPVKLKGKVYKTVVRPAMLYGSECWPIQKKQEQQLHVNEMKMLRWSTGVTLLDKVKNEYIRGSLKVTPIAEKVKENRLRWYGHVMRREENHMVKLALNISTHKRTRGRPCTTWMTKVKKDLQQEDIDPTLAHNRRSWRLRIRKADPT